MVEACGCRDPRVLETRCQLPAADVECHSEAIRRHRTIRSPDVPAGVRPDREVARDPLDLLGVLVDSCAVHAAVRTHSRHRRARKQTLCAYVRQNSGPAIEIDRPDVPDPVPPSSEDAQAHQATLDAIDRRSSPLRLDGGEIRKEVAAKRGWMYAERPDVRASLCGVRLEGAWLFDAQMQGATLEHARLEGAYLPGADMRGANLNWHAWMVRASWMRSWTVQTLAQPGCRGPTFLMPG